MRVLVIAEHEQQQLQASTYRAVSAALQLSEEVDVFVMGDSCADVANQAARLQGVSQVLLAQHAAYQHQLAENAAELIQRHAGDYRFIVTASTTFGKDLMPRLCALLDIPQLSAITAIIDPDTFVRPIYAGNALATVSAPVERLGLTIQPTAFAAVAEQGEAAPIKTVDDIIENDLTQFIEQSISENDRPELTSARVVVSGGRGLGSQENFTLIEQLADALGAAVGASRAAVDAGFIANDTQVGQTGKIVAPELYIAVGISGAIQHLAGMKDSRIIVAINKDEEAPIFQVADYGLVGDLFELVPELTQALK